MAIPGVKLNEVKLVHDRERPYDMAKKFSVADWKILGKDLKIKTYEVAGDLFNIPGLIFSIHAQRYAKFYIIMYMIPLIMIVFMSWFAFWIDPAESNTRISIAITSMLTLIAYRFLIASAIPKVSYLTRMDIFILGSTLLVFLSLLILSAAAFLLKHDKAYIAYKMDVLLRWLLPILFIIISFSALHIY